MTQARFEEPLQRLTTAEVEDLFLHLLRDREVFEEAKQYVLPEHFDPDTETPMLLLWTTLVEVWDIHGAIRYRTLMAAVRTAIEEDGGDTLTRRNADYLVTESNERDQAGFLHYALTHVQESELDTQTGMALLRRFLEERAIVDRLQELAKLRDQGGIPVTYADILETIRDDRDRIAQVGQSTGSEVIPMDWAPTPVVGIKSMVESFDRFMPNGQPLGGVMGLLAPMGVGKTTSAVQLVVATARYLQYLHDECGEPLQLCVIVTYEEPIERLRNRIIACAAQVSKTTLDTAGSWDDFAPTGKPKAYEKRLQMDAAYMDESGRALGERERIEVARQWVNRNIRIIDHSGLGGDGKLVTRGDGYVPELVAALQRLRRETGMEIAQLVLDYMGKMIDRHFRRNNVDYNMLRHWIRGCPDEIRMKIAEPLKCAVWLLHQLSGENTKKGATARLHHSDAAEGRMFAENMHYCFVIGNKDERTRASLLHCSKDRDTGNENKRTIVELDGEMQTLISREGQLAVDNISERIQDVSDMRRMGGDAAVAHAASPRGRRKSRRPQPISMGGSGAAIDFNTLGDGTADS